MRPVCVGTLRPAQWRAGIPARGLREGGAVLANGHTATDPGAEMTIVLPCPAWCVEHEEPDPLDPCDGGRHCGQETSVLVGPQPHPVLPTVFVQLNAHDCEGHRHSWIDLVAPTRAHAELSIPQARRTAETLIAIADLWDSRVVPDTLLAPELCPPWCAQHDDVRDQDPLAGLWHYGRAAAIPVAGPHRWNAELRIRLCARDTRAGRGLVIALMVQDDEPTELTAPEARQIAAALLNAGDEIQPD
ncbi:DUF6907 domain-containing protein [Nocardia acidivorans]|uniref:DUF6907 domain-containing protein n=1 Tax=Nocardia acidivorans TaxID=404580 RepID=UPI000A59C3B1